MKITKVEICNYKSIGEKCVIDFDDKSTTLVGKSNVGKTNILEAIEFAFNDKPLKTEHICSWNKEETLSVSVFLKVEPKDIPQFEKISSSFAKLKSITVNKYVNGKVEYNTEPDIPIDKWYEPSDELIDGLSNLRARIRRALKGFNNISNQLDANDPLKLQFLDLDTFVNKDKRLQAMQTEDEQKSVLNDLLLLLNPLRQKLDQDQYLHLNTRSIKMSLSYTIQYVIDFIPEVIYIEQISGPLTFENLSGLFPTIICLDSDDELEITEEIAIDDIQNTGSDNFMRGLIDLSRIDIGILAEGTGREIADPLSDANMTIANSLSKYWNQEKLKIILRHETDLSSPDTPKRKIYLDFIGEEGRRGSIFDQSPGTRWFMAFIVEYLANQTDESDTILLLDEPGIMLHAGAQKDLLERFEGTDPRIQFIYTTHSPYMINKNFPLRIRCVDKGDGINTTKGTYVNQKPYATSSIGWEPIRSSIGLPLGASLFVSGINLIVEGITDQIILSNIIQVINNLEKGTKFDLNKISISFAGDYRNLIALAIFCHQETKNAKILLDGDTGAKNREKLLKAKVPDDRIFIMDTIMGKKTIDIEDLFDSAFYHSCVLEAYKELPHLDIHKKLPKTWSEVEKDPTERGITKTDKWGHSKYYKEYFSYRDDDTGGFDKVLVSQKVTDKIITLSGSEQKEIIKPFEKLITKIWEKEPCWF